MDNFETRFKSFDKQMAYRMQMSQGYLDRVVEKNGNKDESDSKINDFIMRSKELSLIKEVRLSNIKKKVDKELANNCTYVPIVNTRKLDDKSRTTKEFFKDQINYRDDINKRNELIRAKMEEDKLKELKPKPKMNNVRRNKE